MAIDSHRWLIAGLGNPGPKYVANRHNIGFMVLESLAATHTISWKKERFEAVGCLWRPRGNKWVQLIKPMSFMNLSGNPIGKAMRYYNIEPDQVVVIHDEMDLPLGRIQIKQGGGAAGHNGIKSCIEHVGQNFIRIRMGIGKPLHGGAGADFVLGDFAKDEYDLLDDVIDMTLEALHTVIYQGVVKAQNKYHAKNLANTTPSQSGETK